MKVLNSKQCDLWYQALLERDSGYTGVFYVGVKTTGVFCIAVCRARKPKRENVEFVKSTKEAILKGYRPCKVCKPLESQRATPLFIREILQEMSEDPARKLKDYDLVKRGIEPNKLRRWFLKHHGITFHAYQRMFRINTAFKIIQKGETVTRAAFDAGFESLSGFNDSFKSIFGVSPKNSREKRIIDLKRLETPLGTMYACAVKEGVCLLEFSDRKMLETELKALARTLNANILQGENEHFRVLEEQVSAYFSGSLREFTVPLYTPGSAFQQLVWKALQNIPYGQVKSYKDQATAVGKPEAVGAVASANGMNRISILIPCHRVIGADGKLTGYGGGIWRKKWLLDFEFRKMGHSSLSLF